MTNRVALTYRQRAIPITALPAWSAAIEPGAKSAIDEVLSPVGEHRCNVV